MPTLSARLVKSPRRLHYCDSCHRYIKTHIRLYGMADVGDKPSTLRLCIVCAIHGSDPKVRATLIAAQVGALTGAHLPATDLHAKQDDAR